MPKSQPEKKKKPGAVPPDKKNNPKKQDGKKSARAAAGETPLNSTLAVEMHHLRRLVREISHYLVSNLESGVVRTIEMTGEIPAGARRNQEIQKILQQVRALEIQPEKGKLSDLRKIRDLVRNVNKRLEGLL